jgi:hypothetical protein
VWKDRWLPCPTSFSVQTPINKIHVEARVSELIDKDSKSWNVMKVKEMFWEEEAKYHY